MKKIISAILTAAMMAAPAVTALAERDTISVTVDNVEVKFDQTPVIDEGRTLVPVRAVFETAGAFVDWDQNTQTATITRGGIEVNITLYDNVLYKNGEAIALDVPAKMVNDRILIPVRAIGEAMDFVISWDGWHSQVVVSTDGTSMRPYAGRSKAFKKLTDAALYYREGTFAWENIDVDGDGSLDTVSFTATENAETETKPLLLINGENCSAALSDLSNTFSFALVKIDPASKPIIMVSSSLDIHMAYFYKYENNTLVPITYNGATASIRYLNNLYFDLQTYILSDLEGITWTDIMITGNAYQIKDGIMKNFYVTSVEPMLPRILLRTYDDDVLYNVYITDSFKPGSYKGKAPDKLMHSYELENFVVQKMYIDEYTPSYSEYYITPPDGQNIVITPYKS